MMRDSVLLPIDDVHSSLSTLSTTVCNTHTDLLESAKATEKTLTTSLQVFNDSFLAHLDELAIMSKNTNIFGKQNTVYSAQKELIDEANASCSLTYSSYPPLPSTSSLHAPHISDLHM